MHTMNINS